MDLKFFSLVMDPETGSDRVSFKKHKISKVVFDDYLFSIFKELRA